MGHVIFYEGITYNLKTGYLGGKAPCSEEDGSMFDFHLRRSGDLAWIFNQATTIVIKKKKKKRELHYCILEQCESKTV